MADSSPSLDLLRRFNAGDEAALGGLLERHRAWLEDYVRRRRGPALRGRVETLDAAQDAVIDFLEYGPRFELADEEQLRALLARIVENNLRDANKHWRRGRRDVAREQRFTTATVLRLDPPAPASESPSAIADRDERRAWIRLALEFLDEDDRRVLLLREWEQRSFPEIASELGMTESGVRMRYQRALPKLADCVGRLRRGGLAELVQKADS